MYVLLTSGNRLGIVFVGGVSFTGDNHIALFASPFRFVSLVCLQTCQAIGLTQLQMDKLPANMAHLSLYDTVRECYARKDGGDVLADAMKELYHLDNSVFYPLKVSGTSQQLQTCGEHNQEKDQKKL